MFFPLSEETGLEVNMYDFMPLFHPDGGLEQHIEERGNLYLHKSLMKE